jgi:hypothetical protein
LTQAPSAPAAEASAAHAFSSTSVSSETEVLILSSKITGAEIYFDGKFAGDTPATISLASGTHEITIKSTGKKDRSREIEVRKGSQVALYAVFVQSPERFPAIPARLNGYADKPV